MPESGTWPVPIHFCPAAQGLAEVLATLQPSSVHFLFDEHTWQCCRAPFADLASTDNSTRMPAGEAAKNLDTCSGLWEDLFRRRADRRALLVCVGGGVVCDLGGFAASVFKRGIQTVYIPTTLLAQVDAAIGGKTGVDAGALKNALGTFSDPLAVLIDPAFLQTLDARQMANGAVEVIKHALLASPDLWGRIRDLPVFPQGLANPDLIREAVRIKCEFVGRDPFDRGIRQALNLGHTLGHALESLALQAGKDLLHGEAVAIGLWLECRLSNMSGRLPEPECREICSFLERHYDILLDPAWNMDDLVPFLLQDKKNVEGQLRLALLRRIGEPETGVSLPLEQVFSVLELLANRGRNGRKR